MKNKFLFFYIIYIFSCISWAQKNLPDEKKTEQFGVNYIDPNDTVNNPQKKIKYYHVEEIISQKFGSNKRVYNVRYAKLISTYDLGPNGKRIIIPVFEDEKEQQRKVTITSKNNNRIILPVIEAKKERHGQDVTNIESYKTIISPVSGVKEEQQEELDDAIKNGKKKITSGFQVKQAEQYGQLVRSIKNDSVILFPGFEKEEKKSDNSIELIKNSVRTIIPEFEKEEKTKRQLAKILKDTDRLTIPEFEKKDKKQRLLAKIIKKLKALKKAALNPFSSKVQLDNFTANLNGLKKNELPFEITFAENAKKESGTVYIINIIEIYERVVNHGYESVEILTTIGDSYYFKNEFENAQKYYEKLFKSFADDVEPEYFYRYSVVLRSENQVKSADQYFKRYNELKYSIVKK